MTVDELAQRRATNAQRIAGARRRPPPPEEPVPGDIGLIVEDLRQVLGMTQEVLAEVLALDDTDLIAEVGALVIHIADVVDTAEQKEGGEK